MLDLYKHRRIDAHVDLTPMIDTLLQLFMIFLLGASFFSSFIKINLPKSSVDQNAPKPNTGKIVVAIDSKGNIYVNNQMVPRDKLLTSLQSLLRISKTSEGVMLLADRKLLYEQILDVMAEIQNSGAGKVILVYDSNLKKENDKDGTNDIKTKSKQLFSGF